ncbi:hypothetical protein FM076_31415 [Streptomyces albus subsp. chlorinus]|uniref:hypothetical protein n=1 Tax=Streptomyces albus TaxID=1888 RepID=UPI001570159C|nr:hypothetical protein [Streptomyces albus]NSC25418.1 hypothetical protein [Streptomyces albus subsp. chlorinus]
MSEHDERPQTPDLPPPPAARGISEDESAAEKSAAEKEKNGKAAGGSGADGAEEAEDYVRDESSGEPSG